MTLWHGLRKALTVLFFLLLFIFFLHPVGGDGDFYHHLNAGRDIFTNHVFPYKDTYTFTAAGKDWVNHSWLSGVIFYLLDTTFGPLGISVFISLIAIFTLIIFAFWLKSYRLSNSSVLLLTLLIAAVLSTRFPSRPEIFTYPFTIAILLIDRLRNQKPYLVLFYPLIILLWANLYGGGVLVGVILLIILAVKQFIIDHYKIFRHQILFYIITSISIPMSLINPYTYKSLFYIYFIKDIGQKEMEWYGIFKILSNAPYAYLLTAQYRILVYFLLAGLVIGLIAFNLRRLKRFFFESLLGLSIFIPIFAFRQFQLAAILSTPLLGLILTSYIKPNSKKATSIILASVAILAILISLWSNPPSLRKPEQYPADLISFMKQNNLKGAILNHPQDGGFLSYYLYPDSYIFADTRDELYLGTHILEDYYQAIAENKVIQLLETYQIDLIVGDLSQGEAFKELFYSSTWSPVYIGGRYFVAIPNSVAQAKKIPMLDFIDPFSFSQAKEGQEQKALELYQSKVSEVGMSVDDQIRYARTLFFLKRYGDAIKVLTNMQSSQNPGNVLFNMGKDYLIALSYLNKRDCTKAKEYLDNTNQGIKGIMLFTPSKKIPSPVENGYNLYDKICNAQLRF